MPETSAGVGVRPSSARALGPRLRAALRSVHRDAGHLAVGLTLVYAASGLAVNHVADWDPNFVRREATHELGPLPGDDRQIADAVRERLGIAETPKRIYRASPDRLDVTFERRVLHVDPQRGRVHDESERPRFLLRAANWLHLNRGKRAWTYVADAYAVGLIVLALSGIAMTPGRRGLLGRGGILVLVGGALPVAYVVLSGGP